MLGGDDRCLLCVGGSEGGEGGDHLLHRATVGGDYGGDVVQKTLHGVGHLCRKFIVDCYPPPAVVLLFGSGAAVPPNGWPGFSEPPKYFFRCSSAR